VYSNTTVFAIVVNLNAKKCADQAIAIATLD